MNDFRRLKRELEEMGMFAPEYKKPIPAYARESRYRDGILPERRCGIS